MGDNKDEKIRVRPARREDMSTVHILTAELAAYLKVPDRAKIFPKDLERDGFDTQPPLFHSIVAVLCEDGKETVIGYVTYVFCYSMLSGRNLDMPALYVREGYRGRGVGRKLLCGVAKDAVAAGCPRLIFDVLKWTGVGKFYESLGAQNLTETLQHNLYVFSKEAMEAMAME